MTHLDLVLEIEEAGIDFVLGQRRQGHRGHELLATLGQHARHLAARLADQPDKLASCVSRDPAADDEEDVLSPHGLNLGTRPPPRQPPPRAPPSAYSARRGKDRKSTRLNSSP